MTTDPPERKPVVFFVDDEEGIRHIANRLLRKRGFEMIGAELPVGFLRDAGVRLDNEWPAARWVALTAAVDSAFDLSPGGIIRDLGLKSPIFEKTAYHGHFGRNDVPWEDTSRKDALTEAVASKAQ